MPFRRSPYATLSATLNAGRVGCLENKPDIALCGRNVGDLPVIELQGATIDIDMPAIVEEVSIFRFLRSDDDGGGSVRHIKRGLGDNGMASAGNAQLVSVK